MADLDQIRRDYISSLGGLPPDVQRVAPENNVLAQQMQAQQGTADWIKGLMVDDPNKSPWENIGDKMLQIAAPLKAPTGAIMIGAGGMAKLGGVTRDMANKWALEKLGQLGEKKAFDIYGLSTGLEGAVRHEIRDTGAKLTPTSPEVEGSQLFRLEHPKIDVHSTYGIPDILAQEPRPPYRVEGTANLASGQVTINKSPKLLRGEAPVLAADPTEIALHELQHIIQNKEGFSTGSAPTASPFLGEFWNRAIKEGLVSSDVLDNPKSAKAFSNMISGMQKLGNTNDPLYQIALDIYRRAAGEVEARNVSSRFANPALYLAHPMLTEDIPRSDQIDINTLLGGLRGK